MITPVALQLYTMREAIQHDFVGVMRRVAEMGYAGVETVFGLDGTSTEETVRLCREYGLTAMSTHAPLPLGADQTRVLDYVQAIGSPRIVTTLGPDYFSSLDKVYAICDRFNEAHAVAAEQGLKFGLHNHWWEFDVIEGKRVFDVMLDRLNPSIFFEVDVYWAQAAGVDPADLIADLGNRATIVHLKDGPAVQKEMQMALGAGVVDVPGVVAASAGNADWFVVELDYCATDMFDAVDHSLQYLIREGLGRGRTT